jgi:hypothetical protein
MTTAQTLSNQAASDFSGAVATAAASATDKVSGWGVIEYTFADGSILGLRAGAVHFPRAQRVIYRDVCGDIDVRVAA